MKYAPILIAMFFDCLSAKLSAQTFTDKTPDTHSKFWLQPHVGLSWQSTLFKPLFDFSGMYEASVTPYPIAYEKLTQGFGLDLGLSVNHDVSFDHYIGLQVNSRLRYDYFYGGFSGSANYSKEVKAFIADLGAQLVFGYNIKKRTLTIGFGFTINETGKSKTFAPNGPFVDKVKYQYTSLNMTVGYDWKHIGKRGILGNTLQFNYIPHGHPGYPYRDYMTILVGAKIKF